MPHAKARHQSTAPRMSGKGKEPVDNFFAAPAPAAAGPPAQGAKRVHFADDVCENDRAPGAKKPRVQRKAKDSSTDTGKPKKKRTRKKKEEAPKNYWDPTLRRRPVSKEDLDREYGPWERPLVAEPVGEEGSTVVVSPSHGHFSCSR